DAAPVPALRLDGRQPRRLPEPRRVAPGAPLIPGCMAIAARIPGCGLFSALPRAAAGPPRSAGHGVGRAAAAHPRTARALPAQDACRASGHLPGRKAKERRQPKCRRAITSEPITMML